MLKREEAIENLKEVIEDWYLYFDTADIDKLEKVLEFLEG